MECDSGDVIKIDLDGGKISGVLDLSQLRYPEFSSLRYLWFRGCNLSGTIVNFAALPRSLLSVDFGNTHVSGTFNRLCRAT